MKPKTAKIQIFSSVMFCVLCAFIFTIFASTVGCASGEIEENAAQQNDPQQNDPQQNDPQQNDPQQNDPQQNDPQQNDPQQNTGEPCEDVQCSAGESCDPDTGDCVDCLDDEGCSNDQVCNTAQQECVDCLDDTDCDGELVCDEAAYHCVECLDETDCDGELICDESSQQCVGCVDDQDCLSGEECDAGSQQCVMIGECLDNEGCPDGEVCDEDGYECVECADSEDCDGEDVCEPDFQECVECLTTDDCADGLVCDESGHTCVECVDEGDCDGAMCHPDFAACQAPCCEFSAGTTEPDVQVYFRGFGIAIDSDGIPLVGIADRSTDRVVIHEQSGSTWSVHVVDNNIPLDILSALKIAVTPDDVPHLVLGNSGELIHYWREGTQWSSAVLDDSEGGSFKYVDIGSDDDGTVHIIATRYVHDTVYYEWRTDDGQRGDDALVIDEDKDIDHARMDVRPNGEPVVVARMTDGTVYFVERVADSWQTPELVGESDESYSVADVAVDADGVAQVATSQTDNATIWQQDGDDWLADIVTEDEERGREVRIAFDGLGEPHLLYAATGQSNEIYYARREGSQWVDYLLGEFQQSYWALAVGEDGWVHAGARGSASVDSVQYVTTEP